MSHKPFRSISLAYNEIYKYLSDLAPGDVRSTLQIWNALSPSPNMKNIQQVIDALRTFYAKGMVSRLREGKSYMYWANAVPLARSLKSRDVIAEHNTLASAIRDYDAKRELPEITLAHLEAPLKVRSAEHEVPHVVITDACITVTHSKYKLTLELS